MDMRRIAWAFLPSLFWVVSPLRAQSEQLRRADKQYEYHAYASALSGYRDLDRRNPGSGWVEGRIGACLLRLNQPLEALPFLKSASGRKNSPPDNLRLLGTAYRSIGKYREARSCFQDLAAADSAWSDHFLRLCDWALEAGPAQEQWQVDEMKAWNSPASDFGIAPNDSGWVFSSFRSSIPAPPPGWVSGQTTHYLYQLIEKEGAGPVLLKRELGYVPNEGPCAVDVNSGRVVFMRAIFHSNQQLTKEAGFSSTLFAAQVDSRGHWENVRPFDHNGTGFSTAWPSLSKDAKRLYFSSDRQGGHGGYDLYVSRWNGAGWGEPINLGPTINTPGNEITPWEWEGNLLFASDWHPGFGGFDLFTAYRSGEEYITVSNMGKPRNSSRDDLGPVMLSSGGGYLVSNRKGLGDMDIYRMSREGASLHFVVRDAVSGDLLPGVLVYPEGDVQDQVTSSVDGVVVLAVADNFQNKVLLRKQGYVDHQVDLRLAQGKDGVQVFSLWPEAWEFQPVVSDMVTGRSLSAASLELADKKTGFRQKLSVDRNGTAKVRLKPQSAYEVVVSCAGYETSRFEYVTGSLPADHFPKLALQPSTLLATTKLSSTSGKLFAIQLGAVKLPGNLDLSAFGEAKEFGDLFVDSTSGFAKVRLGYFTGRQEADSISRLLAEKGFRDRLLVSVEPVGHSGTGATGARQGGGTTFRLRLAALRDPTRFDEEPWSGFGVVLREPAGDFTVISVAGLPDIKTARILQEKARKAGFPDAKIQLESPDGLRTLD